MSQLTNGGAELDEELYRPDPNRHGIREAEHVNEALGHDASTSDVASSKLDALTSHVDATQQSRSYVSEWLQRTDSDSSRTTYSASPNTVIEAGASPEGFAASRGHRTGPQYTRGAAGQIPYGIQGTTTAERWASLSIREPPLRPRSRSRSLDKVASPRSQRPRSPSPVRRQSITVFAEEPVPEPVVQHTEVGVVEEGSPQRLKRPLRPRSPSLERVACLSDTASQKTFKENSGIAPSSARQVDEDGYTPFSA